MKRTWYLLAMAFALAGATVAYAQQPQPPQAPPPATPGDDAGHGVARLSLVKGEVYIQRADVNERSSAIVNAPLMAGDVIGTGANGRAEVQFDSANMVRLAENAEVRVSELTRSRYQVQVGRGTVLFSVIRESHAQVEISTPQVSVRPVKPGAYRVTVQEDGQAEITPRLGEAEIYTPSGVETLKEGGSMMVRGTPADPEFQNVAAVPQDDFDHWNAQRDEELKRSPSYQRVSPDINGSGDLDNNGRWVQTPDYGQVWTPNASAAPGWAPYQNGQWVWEDWYGWTWVSYDPWGWAPYHYGRWFFRGGIGWCWYPGPVFTRCYYSPALVAFFGFGGGVGIGFGGLGFGWVPLAPFEVIHPWWGAGFYGGFANRAAFAGRVNVIANANVYSTYRNARVAGGVTAVNSREFANGRFTSTMRVSPEQLRSASLVRGQVPIAPSASSLRFSDRPVTARSTTNFNNTHFFSHSTPAAVNRVPFAQQQRSLGQISSHTSTTSAAPSAGSLHAGAETASRGASTAGSSGTDGWRRFGSPAEGTAAHSPANGGASNSWHTPGDRPATSGSSEGWRRYQPGSEPAGSRYGATGSGSPRSLQIAPPIVRERSSSSGSATAKAPSSGGGHVSSYGGGGGHSSGGGGGGSHGHR
jgi:hypothetical protein